MTPPTAPTYRPDISNNPEAFSEEYEEECRILKDLAQEEKEE